MGTTTKLSFPVFQAQFSAVWNDAEQSEIVPYSNALRKSLKRIPLALKINDAVARSKAKKQQAKLTASVDREKSAILAKAYILYQNAFDGTLPCMVFGASRLRSSDQELQNFGAISEVAPACRAGLVPSLPETKKGGVLCDNSWNVIKNDAYMLGAIHAGKTFYLFRQENESLDEMLWDEKHNRPHMTGREIAMLYAAGYRQVAPEADKTRYGATFVCLDRNKAENFTYAQALAAANKVRSITKLYPMLEPVLEEDS